MYQGSGTEEKVFKKRNIFKEDLKNKIKQKLVKWHNGQKKGVVPAVPGTCTEKGVPVLAFLTLPAPLL